MGIDLGGVQRGMTQKLLDDPDVCLVLQHGSGAGVAEGVAMDVLLDLCLLRIFFDQYPYRVMIQRVAAGG